MDFVVGLTNDDPAKKAPVFNESYTIYGQPSDDNVDSHHVKHVQFPPLSEKFRYVIVQNFLATGICLKSVHVWDPDLGKY